jgi:peptidoglycan hydrolase CwlO-like protein
MVRPMSIFLALVLVSSVALAQSAPNQSGMSGHMAQQQKMSAMHDEMMKSMQADLDNMKNNLQKMKDQLGKVSDQGTKDELQANIDMWQSVISHMDKHMSMMKEMMGSEHGMMMRRGQNPSAKK